MTDQAAGSTDPLDAIAAAMAAAAALPISAHVDPVENLIHGMRPQLEEIVKRSIAMPDTFEGKEAIRAFAQHGLVLLTALPQMSAKYALSNAPAPTGAGGAAG